MAVSNVVKCRQEISNFIQNMLQLWSKCCGLHQNLKAKFGELTHVVPMTRLSKTVENEAHLSET